MKGIWGFLCFLILPLTLVAQVPTPLAPQEKVQITVDGELYTKVMPNTIPELKEFVRWLANKVNEMNLDSEAERKDFTAKLEESSKRTDEILASINAMGEANKQIVDSVGKIQDIKEQINNLTEQLKKKPYSIFVIAQPGLAIGPSFGYGGGFTLGTTIFDFGLIGVSTHVYTTGTFDLGLSIGMMF